MSMRYAQKRSAWILGPNFHTPHLSLRNCQKQWWCVLTGKTKRKFPRQEKLGKEFFFHSQKLILENVKTLNQNLSQNQNSQGLFHLVLIQMDFLMGRTNSQHIGFARLNIPHLLTGMKMANLSGPRMKV